jgi:hypothetical protein
VTRSPTRTLASLARFVIWTSTDLRTFVIVQTTFAFGVTVTLRAVPPPLASTVVSCLHTTLEVYSPRLVPAEATSPTL